ncbi:MAG: hypothetical protein ACI8VT_003811, partial [Saprospiraceae bacterium]
MWNRFESTSQGVVNHFLTFEAITFCELSSS